MKHRPKVVRRPSFNLRRMTPPDDPNENIPIAGIPESVEKPTKKKAVKKKAARKAAKKKAATQADDQKPSGAGAETGAASGETATGPEARRNAGPPSAGATRGSPSGATGESAETAAQGKADPGSVDVPERQGAGSSGRNGPSGGPSGQPSNGNRGQKFKSNNKKKSKNRWKQKKRRRPREEELPIELGELTEEGALPDVEGLLRLAEDLGAQDREPFSFNEIYSASLTELRERASTRDLALPHAPNRDQLINALVAEAAEAKRPVTTIGVLELFEDAEGGLLVYERDSYRIRSQSAFVPQSLIERFGMERGHIVEAQLHPHRENESCPFVVKVERVMGREPESLGEIPPFTERVPYYPTKRILLEADSESKWDNLSMRVVDCLTPVGFGQRGLIVAPPRTGKTVLLQGMANSIQKNYPEAHLIILLIDERPEEVTDFRRQVDGEVISSTFDESAESHVHAAEMVIEKARRMVEVGEDVVILLDSITRLARAYNTTMPNSGKILSGGVEANALQKPKRFFGSARNIEEGGSLTIIATALVETGSKMDEVIFEEFKGTGNMELHLDRGLSDKRIYPALSMDRSGTRKEELLYHPDEMQKIYSLRRAMKGLPSTDAMEMLIQRIKKTQTNAEFLMSVSR